MISAETTVKDSYNLLAMVIDEAYAGAEEGNLREAFVYRHGLTILRLAEDAIHLEGERKCHSSPIVVRSMLESLFNLVAGVKHPAFAAEKICWEIEDEIKRIGKWLNCGADLSGTVRELQSLSGTLRTAHGITKIRNWTTLDCAMAAELDQHYRTEYFLFSKKVHATQSGMISSEAEVGRGHILQTICFVLVCAAVHIAQLIQTKTPQKHVDNGTQLLQRLCDLVRVGVFRTLDADLQG
jgi:hypothetical protein